MDFLLLSIILTLNLLGIAFYIRYARSKALLDIPNARSSHRFPTVRSGGLLFAPTFVFLLLWFFPLSYATAMGVALVGLISWRDDLKGIPVRWRLLFHFLAVFLLLLNHPLASGFAWYFIGLILLTGWTNTFNFMDGINGMTAVYALVWIFSIMANQEPSADFRLEQVQLGSVFALVAFLFYNFRKRALCFAGDVGSIPMALILAWFFLNQWEGALSLYLFAFPAVYAVDSVLTIFMRLRKRENIFKAHRYHLYQLLANEQKIDHRLISLFYGSIQLGINLFSIYMLKPLPVWQQFGGLIAIYLTLCSIYFLLRRLIIKLPKDRDIPIKAN